MLENILKYQEIEGNLIAEENDLLKSKDREKAAEIQDAFAEYCVNKLNQLNNDVV